MTFNLRISLCIFGIVAAFSINSFSTDLPAIPVTSTKSLTEVLPDSFVQIELVNPSLKAFSIQQTMSEIVQIVSTNYYSLLNWKSVHRETPVEIESYNRLHHFGHWVNDSSDQTCYNTRAKVLIRDSAKTVIFEPTNVCTVKSGQWNDPYAKKILTDAQAEVQIDHMVPLKNAYVAGAHSWSFKTRCLYGNYLGAAFHLISVDGTENMKKGSSSPEGYLPPNSTYRCQYLKNWLTIKTLWNLEMTPSEATAITAAIKAENCEPGFFTITTDEISQQHEFAAKNSELCANVANEMLD